MESIASTDAAFCVDFFEDPSGGYGFEHFRTDAEDRGRWTTIGRFGSLRFDTADEALQEAAARIEWLTFERKPSDAVERWGQHLASLEANPEQTSPNQACATRDAGRP